MCYYLENNSLIIRSSIEDTKLVLNNWISNYEGMY